MSDSTFIFLTCQIGAEAAVKAELARDRPGFRFAFSRPGFLTFKLPSEHGLGDECLLGSVFARASAFSLGKASGGTVEERAAQVWQLAGDRPIARLHVWQRDLAPSGQRGLQLTQPPPLVVEADEAIRRLGPPAVSARGATRRGDLVLDCVIVEPDQWWVGWHRAGSVAGCWPGGLFWAELFADAVSRAYLKMEEALAWSRLPIRSGDVCVEIGSAPGGASQALLRHGVKLIGIDPADMDPRVLANPRFEHWKKRGADVRRREFRNVRWLMADMNVAPRYTLDTVGAIVTHADVRIEGMLLTLKLMDGSPTGELPQHLDQIRSWGFAEVAARQLHHNRREVCVVAKRGRRKVGAKGAGAKAKAKRRTTNAKEKVPARGAVQPRPSSRG